MTSYSTLLSQQADTATMLALSGRICPQLTDTPAAKRFGVCPSQHSAETLGCRSAGTRANQDAGFMAHQPSMQPTPMGCHVSQQSASQGRSERPGLLVSRMLALRLGITTLACTHPSTALNQPPSIACFSGATGLASEIRRASGAHLCLVQLL